MTLANVLAKTTVGFSGADKTDILSAIATIYNGSSIAKTFIDDFLSISGKTINIQFDPRVLGLGGGVLQLNSGTIFIDPPSIPTIKYITPTGKAVSLNLVHLLVHEFGHALSFFEDDQDNRIDFKGQNVVFTNPILTQLGIPERLAYNAIGTFDANIRRDYEYTNGATIDIAYVGNNQIINTSFAPTNSRDLLIGGLSDNIIQSADGNDFLFGGGGNDTLDGGTGIDTAVYYGTELDYDITQDTDSSWTVRNVRGQNVRTLDDAGTDTLKNIEFLQFDGGKTYELKKRGLTFQTDFVLVIDTTGSMGDSIDSVKAQAASLIDAVFDNGKGDGRIGVVSFKDAKDGEPSEVILPFTDQDDFQDRKSSAINAINSLSVGGGGDIPETAFDGLRTALNGSIGQWRGGAGVLRIALFTDAPANDGELAGEVTALAKNIGATISGSSSARFSGFSFDSFSLAVAESRTSSAGDSHFSFGACSCSACRFGDIGDTPDPSSTPSLPFILSDEPLTPDLTTAEVQIFTIFTGPDGSDTLSLQDISTSNGGAFLTAPTNDELVRQLLEIISAPPTTTNAAPTVANPIADQITNEDAPLTFVIPVNSFANSNVGNTLTLTSALEDGSALPTWLTFDALTKTFSGTPANENVGTISLKVTATDTSGASVFDVFDLTVINTNDAPILVTPTPDQTIATSSSFSFTLPSTAFTDVDAGDTLTLSATLSDGTSLPTWLSFNPATEAFSGVPSLVDIGTLDIKVTATDSFGATASDIFQLSINPSEKILNGTSRSEKLSGTAADDIINGFDGFDLLYGNDGNDNLFGGNGFDSLFGGIGNDILDGGSGLDLLVGGQGNDVYFIDNRFDVVFESANAGLDTVYTPIDFVLPFNVENIILTGTAPNKTAAGNNLANTLTANSVGSRLYALGGNDTLYGGSGNDTLDGGFGDDLLRGYGGANTFVLNSPKSGVDTIQDFDNTQDKLQISARYFGGGLRSQVPLNSNQLVTGSGVDDAINTSQRFIYNTDNGKLYFDADGSGKSEKVQIALFSNNTNLNVNNFTIAETSIFTLF